MNNYLDIVKEAYCNAISANKGDELSLSHVDIKEDKAEFAYCLCHPILGNVLEFGWARGAKTDTPSIRLAMVYCAYAGLVAKHFEDKGVDCTPEQLFYRLANQGGMMHWDRNARQIIGIDTSREITKKITLYLEQCVDVMSVGLPTAVYDEKSEIKCVDACVAMFFVGKSICVR